MTHSSIRSRHHSHRYRRQRRARSWSVEGLEERCLLAVDFSQVKSQLPGLLSSMQSALTQKVLADSMPMVGNALQNPVINNPARLCDAIGSHLAPKLPGNQNATDTDVQDALFNTLKGMNLFPQGSQEGQDVQVVQNGPNDYEFKVHLSTQSPIVISKPFDLALPKTGISASGKVNASLSYTLELDFGVDLQNGKTHLYLDTSPSPELTLTFDVSMSPAKATGDFGTLGVNLYDGALPKNGPWKTSNAAPSEFQGTFTFDVTGPGQGHILDASQATPAYFLANTDVTLKGHASVDLGAELTVNNFPAMALNLQVDWPFTQGNLDGDRPTVAFNDLQLDVGTFFTFLQPYFKQLHTAMTPVDTVVEAFTKPLPVLSALPGESGLSLWSIAQGIDPNLTALQPFVTAFKRLYTLSSQQGLPTIPSGKVIVDYGSFDLGNADPRDKNFDLSKVNPHITTPNQPTIEDQLAGNPDPDFQSAYKYIYDPQTGLEGQELGSLQLNFLDDSATAFRAMLLQDVTLIQYTMPSLDSWSGNKHLFRFDQTFPLGPVSFEIAGDIRAKASMTFGYDTYGLVNLGKPNPIQNEPDISPLDGLFIKDASASLSGDLSAKLILNVPVFQPYVKGGVTANVDLHLQPDPNDPSNPVRFSQLDSEISQDPLDIFQLPAGKVDGYLDVGVRIGVDFGWPIGFVGADFSTQVAQSTLLDFDHPSQKPLPLAHYDPNDPTTLILNIGTIPYESFEVGHHPGNTPKGKETVDVSAFDETQTFTHVARVVAQGNNNPETILFDADLLADAQVNLGNGDNQVTYLGKGDATITAGMGNNKLSGGSGTNTLRVIGDGANTLIGGPGTNKLAVVGNGPNILTAGAGDDTLSVQGDGANLLTAGPGHDTITITASPNTTNWNSISWQSGDGDLDILARGGHNAVEVAGSNNPDVFTVSPYPRSNSTGVQVTASTPAGQKKITALHGYVQTVAIDGGAGADTTTVKDLGPNTQVQEVGVNLGEALGPDGSDDLTTVNGNPDTHAVTVGTESAWLHHQQGANMTSQDGGVMMVRTRPQYKVNDSVVDQEDELDVNVKGSKNAVAVRSNTGHTVIRTDVGSDSFVIGGDPAPNNGQLYYVPPKPASPKLLFGLYGPLEIHAGPGSNSLALIGDQEPEAVRLTMTDSSLEGFVGSPSRPIDVQYSVDPMGNLQGGIALETGHAADTVLLQSTPAGAPVSILTGGGGDRIFIGDTNKTLDSIRGPVLVDGGDVQAIIAFDDQGAAGGKDYLFTTLFGNTYLVRSNPVPPTDPIGFRYKNLGAIVLNAGGHGNTVMVRSTAASVAINAGGGDNTIRVGDPLNGNHWSLTRPLTVNGQNGTNHLYIDDQGTVTPNLKYMLGLATVKRTGAGQISYSHVQDLTLNAASGNGTTINVPGTAAGANYQVQAGPGTNTLTGPNGLNVWDINGANSGVLKSTFLQSPVAFSGIQNLHGGSASDVFRIHTGGSISGTIDGAGGLNSLDYSGDVADIVVDLLVQQATEAGKVLGIANVTGSSGNDILVGGGTPGVLRGGMKRGLIITGVGASQVVGGGDDTIMIAGTTAYDANVLALQKILDEWEQNTPVGVRVAHIRSGGGLNGPFLLHTGQNATVQSNLKVNDLTDGGGVDWLFLRTAVDKHHNGKSTDVVTSL